MGADKQTLLLESLWVLKKGRRLPRCFGQKCDFCHRPRGANDL